MCVCTVPLEYFLLTWVSSVCFTDPDQEVVITNTYHVQTWYISSTLLNSSTTRTHRGLARERAPPNGYTIDFL